MNAFSCIREYYCNEHAVMKSELIHMNLFDHDCIACYSRLMKNVACLQQSRWHKYDANAVLNERQTWWQSLTF